MQILNQDEAKKTLVPVLKSLGKKYKKFGSIIARPGVDGEVIHTVTHDGFETTNVIKPGDYVVTNNTEAKEQYILTAKQINNRYHSPELFDNKELEDKGYRKFRAKGVCFAVESDVDFLIVAAWGETQPVKVGDMIASPDDTYSEVYRIARKEFFETYEPAT